MRRRHIVFRAFSGLSFEYVYVFVFFLHEIFLACNLLYGLIAVFGQFFQQPGGVFIFAVVSCYLAFQRTDFIPVLSSQYKVVVIGEDDVHPESDKYYRIFVLLYELPYQAQSFHWRCVCGFDVMSAKVRIICHDCPGVEKNN